MGGGTWGRVRLWEGGHGGGLGCGRGTWGRVRLWEGGHGGGLSCVEEDM